MNNFPADKGQYMGSCNRSACLRPGAKWWNRGSRAFYCTPCAHILNKNQTWDGQPLCELKESA